MKFSAKVGNGPKNKWLVFGGDLGQVSGYGYGYGSGSGSESRHC